MWQRESFLFTLQLNLSLLVGLCLWAMPFTSLSPVENFFFFPFPPCRLLPYLATAFLFDFLEAPSLADNVFPLLGETGSLDETEYSGKNFFPGTQTFIMEKVLGIIQNDYSFPSRWSHKGICLRFSLWELSRVSRSKNHNVWGPPNTTAFIVLVHIQFPGIHEN